MTAVTATRTRPSRPPAPALPPFEALDRTHRRVLEVLKQFDMLLEHLGDNGPDAVARRSAAEIGAFFDGHARRHHADEETQVFPALLACGNAELVHHVHRLQQDHGWLEEDWRLLSPQMDVIAQGLNGYDLDMLRHALPIFTALYRDHIGLEEALIYPEAKRRLGALDAGGRARHG